VVLEISPSPSPSKKVSVKREKKNLQRGTKGQSKATRERDDDDDDDDEERRERGQKEAPKDLTEGEEVRRGLRLLERKGPRGGVLRDADCFWKSFSSSSSSSLLEGRREPLLEQGEENGVGLPSVQVSTSVSPAPRRGHEFFWRTSFGEGLTNLRDVLSLLPLCVPLSLAVPRQWGP